MAISLAARSVDDLGDLCSETNANAYPCDASLTEDVDALFEALDGNDPDVVIYNPSARVRGPFIEIDREATKQAIMITAYGGFLVAQAAAKRMVPKGHGAILFTGASASVKGYVQSASFAMGKFALRGLAQSMARELHPMGIHIGHFNIDGGIRNINRPERIDSLDNPDSMLDPDAIARSYLNFLKQDRSSWAWELELRPWVEKF
jgi:NAD(P)-dependent dehydrogenase (short-subunit alcohol dehydrogenase family)